MLQNKHKLVVCCTSALCTRCLKAVNTFKMPFYSVWLLNRMKILSFMWEAAMTVLSMKDSFNLWQNGCVSPLPEKVEEIYMVTLLQKRVGATLCVNIHRNVGFRLVWTHQTCKLRKVNEFMLKFCVDILMWNEIGLTAFWFNSLVGVAIAP